MAVLIMVCTRKSRYKECFFLIWTIDAQHEALLYWHSSHYVHFLRTSDVVYDVNASVLQVRSVSNDVSSMVYYGKRTFYHTRPFT